MNNAPEKNLDPAQKIVNKAAETAISSQLKSVGKIDVDLNSEVPKLIQGEANALKITGEKIIVFQDLQLEQIDLACQDLSLNLTQAILGNIAFDRPGDFKVKLVFTETDCDRLLNSEYVKILLQNLQLDLDPQPSSFYLQQGTCRFDDDGGISLIAAIVLQRSPQTKTARFKVDFRLNDDGSTVEFIGGKYLEDRTLGWDETAAVMRKAGSVLYLRHFTNEDLCLNITQVQVQNKQLIIKANVQVKQLPNSLVGSIESVSSQINQQ